MGRTRVETRARARALQALYAWDMRGGTELERVASQVWDDLAITPEERRVAGPIVRHVANRQVEVAHHRFQFFEHRNGLLQIDNMNAVSCTEIGQERRQPLVGTIECKDFGFFLRFVEPIS